MLPDRISNPGPLTYESGALPIALRGPASTFVEEGDISPTRKSVHRTRMPPPNAIQKKGLYVTVTGIP